MLPLKYRLSDRRLFSQVFSKGSFFSGRNISMKLLVTDNSGTRVGFSVGLKYSKKAVARNKLKRWLREAVRKDLEQLKPGFDLVIFTTKKTSAELKFHDIEKETRELFKKSRLLN